MNKDVSHIPQHITKPLNETQRNLFAKQGYLILRDFNHGQSLQTMQTAAQSLLAAPTPPYELESETGYPGAPISTEAEGGSTPRRLRGMYGRGDIWQDWARQPGFYTLLKQLLHCSDIYLTQSHHNSLMSKHPSYSSDTGWHQDIRYWSYSDDELINLWLALTPESPDNGSLSVIPGSHLAMLESKDFDENLFYCPQSGNDSTLLMQAIDLQLNAGDLLIFHAKLLHCASRNRSQNVKQALVYTYRARHTRPQPNSRSTRLPDIALKPTAHS